jgi:hypothetical protein
VCDYIRVCFAKAKPSLHKSRVAEKSVKRAPNLQDLLCLTVFIYIIYLPTILLRFRLLRLKSIYLLREHYTKSLAESSYSLLRGSDFSLQISLPGVIPMALNTEPIPVALPPWKLKGTIYTFMIYVSAKEAQILSSDKSFLYSPLEARSDFAKDKLVGGLGMVQVIRYWESPVGPYDEFVMSPGTFEYDGEVRPNDGKTAVVKKNMRVTRIYVSQKDTCWNGRTSERLFPTASRNFRSDFEIAECGHPKLLQIVPYSFQSGCLSFSRLEHTQAFSSLLLHRPSQ